MKRLVLILVLLGVCTPSNTLFGQKNRISLQTGLFHQFFDKTPMYNGDKVSNYKHWKFPLYYFGGQFNDSWGFQFQRLINDKSSISCEYMLYSAVYQPVYTNWTNGPRIHSKRLHKINVTYSRNIKLNDKWQFNYGAGLNTQWGIERWFLITGQHSSGFWEPHYQNNYRKDFGINLRTGFEYSPIARLTIFSYFDFQNTVFLRYPSDGNEKDLPTFFEENGHKIKASLYDLSLNFGIGFNF